MNLEFVHSGTNCCKKEAIVLNKMKFLEAPKNHISLIDVTYEQPQENSRKSQKIPKEN